MHHNEYLMHFFYAVGDAIEEKEAAAYLKNLRDNEIISGREAVLLGSALSTAALGDVAPEKRNTVRAQILRHVLLSLMR